MTSVKSMWVRCSTDGWFGVEMLRRPYENADRQLPMSDSVEAGLKPFDCYVGYMIAGAKEIELPAN